MEKKSIVWQSMTSGCLIPASVLLYHWPRKHWTYVAHLRRLMTCLWQWVKLGCAGMLMCWIPRSNNNNRHRETQRLCKKKWLHFYIVSSLLYTMYVTVHANDTKSQMEEKNLFYWLLYESSVWKSVCYNIFKYVFYNISAI